MTRSADRVQVADDAHHRDPSAGDRALLDSLGDVGPRALTSCPGWSAHHIAAHIAGNHEEARRHVEAYGEGRPLASTRSFEEREAPLLRLGFDTLLSRIEAEESGLLQAVAAVLAGDPEAELRWTGRTALWINRWIMLWISAGY